MCGHCGGYTGWKYHTAIWDATGDTQRPGQRIREWTYEITVYYWDAQRPARPPTTQSPTEWLNNLIVHASWCYLCSSTTGGIIGINCYHSSCTPTARAFMSLLVIPRFDWWWVRNVRYHRMFPPPNLELNAKMMWHHTRLLLGFVMLWKSPMTTSGVFFGKPPVAENDCTTTRQ